MQTPLEIIAGYGVSNTSIIRAIQDLNDPDRPITFRKEQYERNIADIIGLQQAPSFSNEKEARIYFLYTIQETIRAFQSGIPDMEDVWDDVLLRAKRMIENQPWAIKDCLVEDDGEPKLGAAGNPKKRKGAKKDEAEALYRRMNDGNNTRPQIIAALVEEVGLSKPGATTYFHNLKKQFGFSGPEAPKPERKKRERAVRKHAKPMDHKKPSKISIARSIFQEMKDEPKERILEAIMEKANTSRAGANTYYCACRKESA